MNIPLDEITIAKASFVDDAGKVFYWRGDVYRGIYPERSGFYSSLLKGNELRNLYQHGLIETEITPYEIEGFGLVLRHRRVQFPSYATEWCGEMLADAGRLTLDLQTKLSDLGLILKDGHSWNVLFDFCEPKFVDFGSITSYHRGQWQWFVYEFKMRFIYPLYLKYAGYGRLARLFMLEPTHFTTRGTIFKLMLNRVPFTMWLKWLRQDHQTEAMRTSCDVRTLVALRHQLDSIPMIKEKTEWSRYEGTYGASFSPSDDWSNKNRTVYDLICKMRPNTIIDIGANRGWYSELASRQGVKVAAIDIDEPNIAGLYHRAKSQKLTVLPLLMDICEPTLEVGPWGIMEGALPRLRTEMALALAVTHHLVFKRRLRFEQISRYLDAFTQKWLLVEFVDPQDIHVRNWDTSQFPWYNLEGFITALRQYFRNIEVFDSDLEHRYLLLCTK